MLLAIDIGNSKAACGLFRGKRLVRSWSFGITSSRNATFIKGCLLGGIGTHDRPHVDGVCMSSVVPSLSSKFKSICRHSLGISPLFVTAKSSGMKVKGYAERNLGTDRLMSACAAFEIYGGPALVIDAGTAITIDLVTRKGEFAGGVILPGLDLAAASLNRAAEKLPLVHPSPARRIIGRDTRSAISSGIANGYAGMVDHLVGEMSREARVKPKVIVTGGAAKFLKRICGTIDRVHPHLVLEGLRIVWERRK
jgi:type III pantothenate kinase